MRTKILASLFLIAALILVVGCEREVKETIVVQQDIDCFKCHGDNGYILQAQGEYANSVHASGASIDYTNREGEDCARCHFHQGFQDWIANGEVKEAGYDSVAAIHCFTCHSPHLTGDMSVTPDDPVTLLDGTVFNYGHANICANCHQARETPADIADNFVVTNPYWGPHHGPQSDLIVGTAGYEYASGTYTTSDHGGAVGEACVSCHMSNPSETHDGYNIGGHSWNMEYDGYELTEYCGKCHAEVAGVRNATYELIRQNNQPDYDNDGDATEGYMDEMAGLHDSLGTMLLSLGLVNGSNGLAVPGTVADGGVAGALWNYILFKDDGSNGAHNPAYIRELLETSIAYVDAYIAGLPTPPIAGQRPITVASH